MYIQLHGCDFVGLAEEDVREVRAFERSNLRKQRSSVEVRLQHQYETVGGRNDRIGRSFR